MMFEEIQGELDSARGGGANYLGFVKNFGVFGARSVACIAMLASGILLYLGFCETCTFDVVLPDLFGVLPAIGIAYAIIQLSLALAERSLSLARFLPVVRTLLSFSAGLTLIGLIAYSLVFSLPLCLLCIIFWCGYLIEAVVIYRSDLGSQTVIAYCIASLAIGGIIADPIGRRTILTLLTRNEFVPKFNTRTLATIGMVAPRIKGSSSYVVLVWPDCVSCVRNVLDEATLESLESSSIDYIISFVADPPFISERLRKKLVVLSEESYDRFSVSRSGEPVFLHVVKEIINEVQPVSEWKREVQ